MHETQDYMHLNGLRGCAPLLTESEGGTGERTPMGIYNRVQDYRELGVKRGTYAQTISRSGYINMIGRPPFDYSVTSDYRKASILCCVCPFMLKTVSE